MSCGNFSLIGVDGTEAGVYPLRCKRWDCHVCGPRKVRQTIHRIEAGMELGETRFFTLTSPAGEDAETSYGRFPARWKRMHQRIVRRFGPFEYLGVVEPQKRGAAHVHVVYRGPFIPQPWLSRAAGESGFGRIADIRRSHKQLTTYLARYLTKQLASPHRPAADGSRRPARLPKYFRRVRWSRGWCASTHTATRRKWSTWWIADAGQVHAAFDAKARGLTVVDLVVSEANPSLSVARFVRWVKGLREYRPFALPVASKTA